MATTNLGATSAASLSFCAAGPERSSSSVFFRHKFLVRGHFASSKQACEIPRRNRRPDLHLQIVRSCTDDAALRENEEHRSWFVPKVDNLTKEVAVLAFPALLGQAIEPLALLTETAYVGRLGAVELAAVGVSISAFNYVAKCFNIPLLNVTTSFVAEDEAANPTDAKSGKRVLPAVSSSLVLACGIGLIEALLLGFQGGRLLSLMGVTADSVMAAPARKYLTLRAIAAPAAVASLALQGIFRGLKDTTTPLRGIAIASASNIILGPILMFGLGYGVMGAAFAYLASQCAMMCYLMWCLHERVILLPPKLANLNFDRFLKSGGLLLGRTLALLSTMTLSTSMAARQGALPMAAHQVCMQLWLAASLLSDSLAIPVQALLATAFARRERRRAKMIAYRVLQMGLAMGLIMALLLGTSSTMLSKLFTNDAGVLEVMASIMPFVALTQPMNSLAFVLDGIHYGASDFRYASYMTMLSGAIASAVLLFAPSVWGLSGVWIGLATVMTLRAASGLSRLSMATGPWSILRTEKMVFLNSFLGNMQRLDSNVEEQKIAKAIEEEASLPKRLKLYLHSSEEWNKKKRLRWSDCLAKNICKENEYYDELMKYLHRNSALFPYHLADLYMSSFENIAFQTLLRNAL